MADVRFTAAARADLADIDEYGAAEFGDDVADAYSRGFMETFNLLRRHPQAGEARRELGKGVRCVLHRRHRVFYTVKGDVVLVLRILHHARNVRHALLR